MAETFKYTILNHPNDTITSVVGFNDQDAVVGSAGNGTTTEGFIWADGVFTDVPGTAYLRAINNKGRAAGAAAYGEKAYVIYDEATRTLKSYSPKIKKEYALSVVGLDDAGEALGTSLENKRNIPTNYLLKGKQATLLAPVPQAYGSVVSMNENGVVVGGYYVGGSYESSFSYQNGGFTTFSPSESIGSEATAVSSDGTIGGNYTDSSEIVHGYIYNGTSFTTIDPPETVGTNVTGIGAYGEVYGKWFQVVKGLRQPRGFIYLNGQYYTLHIKGANATSISGVNARGSILGFYTLPNTGIATIPFIGQCKGYKQHPCTP